MRLGFANNHAMRLFLALWPDDAVRDRLAQVQRAWDWPQRAARVPPDRLHLTLHFLGEVEDTAARVLASKLPPFATPFRLRLDRNAVWPHGVAVMEATELPPALAVLHGELALLLRELGLREEARRLRPHVTLARHAHGAVPPAASPVVEWAVRGYALVRSHAGTSPRYERIAWA